MVPMYIFSAMILAFVAIVSSYEDIKAKFGEKKKDMTKEITISSINKNKWVRIVYVACFA